MKIAVLKSGTICRRRANRPPLNASNVRYSYYNSTETRTQFSGLPFSECQTHKRFVNNRFSVKDAFLFLLSTDKTDIPKLVANFYSTCMSRGLKKWINYSSFNIIKVIGSNVASSTTWLLCKEFNKVILFYILVKKNEELPHHCRSHGTHGTL